MADMVEERLGHSINAVGVRYNCVWVMITGGLKLHSTQYADILLLELSEEHNVHVANSNQALVAT